MSVIDDLLLIELEQLKKIYIDKSLEVVVKKVLSINSKYENKIKIGYKCDASLAFAAREIDDISWKVSDDEFIELIIHINFFGLQSVNSPLPLNLHEQIVHDVNNDSNELNDFYNFFNNRLVELLAESFYKNVLARNNIINDIWPNILGLALQVYSDDKQVFYRIMNSAPLLFGNRISSNNSAKLIENFFEFDRVYIESFVPRVIELKANNLTRLSKANSDFDGGFVLGNETVDIQNSCMIHIYLQDAKEYLPNGSKNALLNKLIKFLLPHHILYSISLHLPKNIPMTLSADNVYLGWTTMVTSQEQPQTIYLEGI
ncbi:MULTISPECIES: type VI secretion system baseplate subunit TssG [Francisella]|uniref:type VI secretion system baseplate subunit TssG n=1 Tax=Francisella TaxID=262 RepID=UPI0011B82FF9|nr:MULTISPECIES: type VI secretion system baseplate subunit TssG [Francisella]